MSVLYWHFVKGVQFDDALRRERIEPYFPFCDSRRAIFLTTSPGLEPVVKAYAASRGRPRIFARITIDADGLPVVDFREWLAGADPSFAEHIRQRVTAYGDDVKRWRFCFTPIGRERWQSVELLEDGAWQPLDLDHPDCLLPEELIAIRNELRHVDRTKHPELFDAYQATLERFRAFERRQAELRRAGAEFESKFDEGREKSS